MIDEITVSRVFPAPQELVYSMFTEKENFAVWFGTDAVHVPLDSLVFDVREGGEIRAVMHLPDGTQKHWLGSFRELDPPHRVVFDLTDDLVRPDDRAAVTVALGAVSGGTEVTLRQETPGWPEEAKAGLRAGYGAFLDTMEGILATQG